MGRQTRRRKTKRTRSMKSSSPFSSSSPSTIEGLHASFDKINDKLKAMVEAGYSDAELTIALKTAWTEQFHFILSDTAIHGLVVHYRKIHKGQKGQKGQKGGNSLALNQSPQLFKFRGGMAPLGAEMAQGTTTSVYGEFPIGFTGSPDSGAMVKALDLGRFYESDVGRSCDSTGGSPAPQQTGGAFWDAVFNGAVLRSVPPNTIEKVSDAITATPSNFPSSDPVTDSVAHHASTPAPFDVGNLHSFSQLSSVISK